MMKHYSFLLIIAFAFLGILPQVACTKKPESNGAGYSGRQINTVITSAKKIQIERVAENKYRFTAPAGTVTREGGPVELAKLTIWNVDQSTLTQIAASQNETEKIDGILVDQFSPGIDGSFIRESTFAPEKSFFLIVASDPDVGNNVPIPAAKGGEGTTAAFVKLESGNPGLAETVFSSTLASSLGTPPAPWVGTKLFGATGVATQSWSSAADSSGNVYVGGVTAAPAHALIAKYNSSGVMQWSRQLGAALLDTYGMGVATDVSGNVYLTGYTYGGLDGLTRMGTIDLFLVKYSSAGVKQWTRQLGVAGASTNGLSVAVDSAGNAFIGGTTTGALDGNPARGNIDLILVKFDSAGNQSFIKQIGSLGSIVEAQSVASDTSGSIYLTGSTDANFDGGVLVGSTDMFLVKFNASGVKQWSQFLGAAGSTTEGRGVTTDPSGKVYVAGYSDGDVSGGGLLGVNDAFVKKYNSDGSGDWIQRLGAGSANTYGYGITSDVSGNVFVTGSTDGGVGQLAPSGTQDTILAKFSTLGVQQWIRQLGVASSITEGFGVSTDSSGNAFMTGSTNGNLLGVGLTGTQDLFLTKVSSGGVIQ